MAGYTEVEDYTNYYSEDLVESVTIRATDDPKYPSGWDYSLHFGTVTGDLVVRYDNAHERTKGHERHAPVEPKKSSSPECSNFSLVSNERLRRTAMESPPAKPDGGSIKDESRFRHRPRPE